MEYSIPVLVATRKERGGTKQGSTTGIVSDFEINRTTEKGF
jgi:hypothetical protein